MPEHSSNISHVVPAAPRRARPKCRACARKRRLRSQAHIASAAADLKSCSFEACSGTEGSANAEDTIVTVQDSVSSAPTVAPPPHQCSGTPPLTCCAVLHPPKSGGIPKPQEVMPAGNLPSYAAHYLQQIGSLPWRQPLTDPTTVPWLSHLAPEAKGSLYEFGRYLLSLTAAGKKGHVTSEQYDMCFDAAHLLDSIAGDQASVAEMLIEACAAFAHSPLAMVVDPRAAVQCVMRTVRRVLGTHGITVITPSVVEQEVQHVCAAGCGKEVGAEGVCFADMGESVVYSCHECAASHRSALQPEQLIYMCWPFNHVDALYVNTVMQRHREGAWELCGSLSCTEETTCAGECIGCVLQPSVQQQCPQFCSHGLASAQGCCSAPSPSTIGSPTPNASECLPPTSEDTQSLSGSEEDTASVYSAPCSVDEEPSMSGSQQRLTRGQAIAAEYAQCAQTHPHLQRVAQVILPPCGERHPDSPAVVAAHEMLVCAAGLLDDKDWEEVMRVCGV